MRRKYNALFHILATLKYETYVVVLIFTAVKKLKPCGSNFSPIFYILFRFY